MLPSDSNNMKFVNFSRKLTLQYLQQELFLATFFKVLFKRASASFLFHIDLLNLGEVFIFNNILISLFIILYKLDIDNTYPCDDKHTALYFLTVNGCSLFLTNLPIHRISISCSIPRTLLGGWLVFLLKSDFAIHLILYSTDFDILYFTLSFDMLKSDSFISEATNLIWIRVSLLLAFLLLNVGFISSISRRSGHWFIDCLTDSSLILNGFIAECAAISSSYLLILESH